MVGCPIPKRMSLAVFITQVSDVTGKNKNISRYGQWMFLHITSVIIKFLMKVACVLYLHFSIYQYRCYLTEYDRKSRFYPIYNQAPYYAETCCKIRIYN